MTLLSIKKKPAIFINEIFPTSPNAFEKLVFKLYTSKFLSCCKTFRHVRLDIALPYIGGGNTDKKSIFFFICYAVFQ